NDSKIRVFQSGSGPDVLLIHGLPGSIEDWDSIVPRLSEHFRVTTFDRSGHGFSEYRIESASLQGNADMTLALIEKLQLKDVILVGHSYGGSIVAAIAARQPANVKGYVSIAGLIRSFKPTDPTYHLAEIPGLGRFIGKVGNQLIGNPMIEKGVKSAFEPNLDAIPEHYIEQRKQIWLQLKNALTTAREATGLPDELEKLDVSQIRDPFTALYGDADQNVDIRNAGLTQQQIPHARVIILKDTGHFLQFARPDSVIDAIEDLSH
ncbi:MAG: alpha/beta hydrolase, partial [Pseudomonadales bacterium]|nr:alpha/beta hydrolase [Pseudomonadales bacterium]